MGVVMFYHLTRSAADETLSMLLPRAMGQGWRVMIRGTDRAALERLDARLWLDEGQTFLPHGMEGGRHDAAQPVLLGVGPIVNAAQGLFLIDGADGAQLSAARAKWKTLTEAGLPAQYWSEEGGRWEKKAERA